MIPLIKNKRGFAARDFIVATLIFSGLLALYVIMVGSIANDYDNTNVIDPEFSEKFDTFSADTERAGEMLDSLQDEGGLSLVGTADLLFFGTFRVISLILESLRAAGSMLVSFPAYFGVPTAITAVFGVLLFTILTVLLVFIIISSVRSGRDL